MDRERGFSLLELLLVVAILLILATMAIPSFLRSRQAANEAATVANVRTINTEEVSYALSAGGNFGTIGDLVSGGLLDSRFSAAVSGYNFTVTASGQDYTVSATPITLNSGRYGYYSSPAGVVRYQTMTGTTCIPCFPTGLSGAPVQ